MPTYFPIGFRWFVSLRRSFPLRHRGVRRGAAPTPGTGSGAQIEITDVAPKVVFPGDDGRYAFTIRSPQISQATGAIWFTVEGEPLPTFCPRPSNEPSDCVGVRANTLAREVVFTNVPPSLAGARRLYLSAEGLKPSAATGITFSPNSESAPRLITLALFLVAGFVAVALSRSTRDAGRRTTWRSTSGRC